MKAECAGAYGVGLEELCRLLPAVPEEREHRGRGGLARPSANRAGTRSWLDVRDSELSPRASR